MNATVTLSANAGVMLEYAGVKILSDFIHNYDVPTFSSVPYELCERICGGDPEFAGAELMLISHEHPDHFNRSLINRYLKNNPSTAVAAPIRFTDRQMVFAGSSGRFKTFNAKVDFVRTPHEKQKVYADAKHYAYTVTIAEKTFTFFNDTSIEPEYITSILKGKETDVLFLNFPWFTLKHGRRLIEEMIRAKNIIVYHLPIPEDDGYGYNSTAEKYVSAVNTNGANIFLMSSPLDRAEIEL